MMNGVRHFSRSPQTQRWHGYCALRYTAIRGEGTFAVILSLILRETILSDGLGRRTRTMKTILIDTNEIQARCKKSASGIPSFIHVDRRTRTHRRRAGAICSTNRDKSHTLSARSVRFNLNFLPTRTRILLRTPPPLSLSHKVGEQEPSNILRGRIIAHKSGSG